ncbi:MAG: hypothetical protein CM15mP129_09030 [Chloroflexota bacterium]|nr:MAG: hypothetical protein CM15mP129_09030 [Chloroflexota bacterium]
MLLFLATTNKPDVSLSILCTIPGLEGSPTSFNVGYKFNKISTSVAELVF